MFADHMTPVTKKPDLFSNRNLLLMAGGLIIVCQLVAMVLVAQEQVKKAEARDSQMSQQRVAIAKCFELNTRAGRQDCMLQARNASFQDGAQIATSANPGRESPSYTDFNSGSSPAVMRIGAVAVSFAAN
ncbi:MAG: hypothetical protein V4614_13310 [Pseudomonadota bacterium]